MKKLTAPQIINTKNKRKLSYVTAYDYTSACIINSTNIDCILVGDSAGVVISGDNNTLSITTELMAYHTLSVARGAKNKFIVADMPFLSYKKDLKIAMDAVELLIKAGANAIKLEGLDGHEAVIKNIIQSGIPVMGHIGLTPQYINSLGGYKIQGKTSEQHANIIQQAKKLTELGCFSLVLECVPSILAKEITACIDIPTIGIGAGKYTDGQVLVWQDLLGLTNYDTFSKKPRFIKEYINARDIFTESLNQYHQEIQSGTFPEEQHSY